MDANEMGNIGTAVLQGIAAAGAVSNPGVASAVALAPLAIQFMQTALQLQQAGAMSPEQLAALFSSVGSGIQSTHARWAAMNAAPQA
jgi:hypothetical protein